MKKDKKTNTFFIFFICILSIFILELLGTVNNLDFRNNILFSFIFSTFLGSIISGVYLFFRNYSKYVLTVIMFFISFIYFITSTSFEHLGVFITLRDMLQSNFIRDYITHFKFEYSYLFYILPMLLMLILPNNKKIENYRFFRVLINILIIPTILITIGFTYENSLGYKYSDYDNYTLSLNNYGYGYTSLRQLVKKDTLSLQDIDSNFNDEYPKTGYMSNNYSGKNLIMIDVRGLSNSLYSSLAMEHISSLSDKSINFTNFITYKSVSENNHVQLQTGLYPENTNQYDYYNTVNSTKGFNLTNLFHKNNYLTLNFTNTENVNSYYLAETLDYDGNGFYNTSTNYELLHEVASKITAKNKFYYHVSLNDSDILKTKVSETYKDKDLLEEEKSILSHYEAIDKGINDLINTLDANGLLTKTVIMIYNSTFNEDVNKYFSNDSKLSYSRSPLIFIDNSKGSVDNSYVSYANIYAGIIDAFSLSGQAADNSISASIFHNPFQTVYTADGSVVGRDLVYDSRRDYFYLTKSTDEIDTLKEIEKLKIDEEYKNNKISTNIKNTKYYHMKAL